MAKMSLETKIAYFGVSISLSYKLWESESIDKKVIYGIEMKFKSQNEITYVTQYTYDNNNHQVHGKD